MRRIPQNMQSSNTVHVRRWKKLDVFRVWWWFMKSPHFEKKTDAHMKKMAKLHNCPQCSVKTKDKNNTTTYKTTCKALFSKQNHRLVVLSFPFLVVTPDCDTVTR